jgi:5-formyltetrahydrofolate cyclo-ligase
MDTIANLKKKLRQSLLQQRRQLTQAEVIDYSQKVFENFQKMFMEGLFGKIEVMAGYMPAHNEVDVLHIMKWVAQRGVQIALPKIVGDNLKFYKWDEAQELTINQFGIKEPTSTEDLMPDCILVAMVGFDAGGNRLGYGSGYYDKALSLLPKVRKIGIAYGFQQMPSIPSEPHDVQLDCVIT